MKGNEKISLTAEAVAFMRAYENSDRFSKYFVSDRIKRKFAVIIKLFPKNYVNSLFGKRLALSREIDDVISQYKPKQIIELACGYSPRGLIMTQKDKELVYFEIDFSSVAKNKSNLFKTIQKREKIRLSKNHYIFPFDVLKDDFSSLIKKVNINKKTLIVAEALVSYLDDQEHRHLVINVSKFLDNFNQGAYLSHETISQRKGLFGKILFAYRNMISKTRSHKHFNSSKEITQFFKSEGFRKIKIIKNEEVNNFIYLAEK